MHLHGLSGMSLPAAWLRVKLLDVTDGVLLLVPGMEVAHLTERSGRLERAEQ